MPKMILSMDGVVIKDVQLTKARTTVGRRPYNDVVIDNLAISGEHAVLHMQGGEIEIEDLNSTNGTYVNGRPAKRQLLRSGDAVELGKYRIRFLDEAEVADSEKAVMVKPAAPAPTQVPDSTHEPLAASAPTSVPQALIKVVSGPAAGREMALTKVVSTIGKPGVSVASITRRHQGYVLAHVEGEDAPLLNGRSIVTDPAILRHGDRIEVAGTEMNFIQVELPG